MWISYMNVSLHPVHNQTFKALSFLLWVAVSRIWFICTLTVCILWAFTSIMMLVGINRDQRFLLLPWIIVTLLNITLDTASVIYHSTNYVSIRNRHKDFFLSYATCLKLHFLSGYVCLYHGYSIYFNYYNIGYNISLLECSDYKYYHHNCQ